MLFVKEKNSVLVIGGVDPVAAASKASSNYLKTVSVYLLYSNTWWEEMSELNKERDSASACIVGTMVYVLFGFRMSGQRTAINSIERISTTTKRSRGIRPFEYA